MRKLYAALIILAYLALTPIGVYAAEAKCYAFSTGYFCFNATNVWSTSGNVDLGQIFAEDQNNYTKSTTFVRTGNTVTLYTVRNGTSTLTASFNDVNSTADVNSLYAAVASVGNWTADKPSYLVSSGLVSALGNWSADKASYSTTAVANGLYAPAPSTWTNITALQSNGGNYYQNVTALQNSNATTNSRIDSLNSTKAGVGNCPAGQLVMNTTVGGVQCVAGGSGSVTSVGISANGSDSVTVYNSPITTSGVFSINFQNATNLQDGFLTASDHTMYSGTYSFLNALWNSYQQLNSSVISVGNWSGNKSLYTLSTGLVGALGNWSADKNSYALVTFVQSAGNWTQDKTSYTLSSGLVTALGNWSVDKASYSTTAAANLLFYPLSSNPSGFYNTTTIPNFGSSNLTIAQVVAGVGNWSIDKPNYALVTYVNSAGNWTAAASSYSTTAAANLLYAPILQTWQNQTSDRAAITSIGNWTADKGSYTLSSGLVTALGNWSADKASYSTTAAANLLYAPITTTYNNITALQNSNTTSNSRIDSLNLTKADKGSTGQVIVNAENITSGTVNGIYNYTGNTNFKSALTVSDGFGTVGTTFTNGDMWADGNIYILGNLTAVNVNQITTNGTVIPNPTNTWNSGNSSNVWLGVYATNFYEGGVALNAKYLTQAGAVTALGNWSADKSSYTTTANLNVYQLSSGLVTAVGNWSADKSSYSTTSAANLLYYPLSSNPSAFYNSTTVPHFGSSNLTSVVVNNISATAITGTTTKTLQINLTDGKNFNSTFTDLGLTSVTVNNVSAVAVTGATATKTLQINLTGGVNFNTTFQTTNLTGTGATDHVPIWTNGSNINTGVMFGTNASMDYNVAVNGNVSAYNFTVLGVSTTWVCIMSTNAGCLVKSNTTCNAFLSPDGTTALKVANNGTTC